MLLHILTFAVAFFAAFLAYLNSSRGEVELLPFTIAKLTLGVLPTTFPANDSTSTALFRNLIGIGSFSFNTLPKISAVNVYIDEVVPNDFRQISIFNSNTTVNEKPRDILVFLYAGAWMLGSVDENECVCRNFALHTNFVVACVEYSLAPEHPFPRAFYDVLEAIKWINKNAISYGGKSNRIFLAGESAGGNLAAAVTSWNYDIHHTNETEKLNIAGLILVYPPLATNFNTESYHKYESYNGMLTKKEMEYAWNIYTGGIDINTTDYRYQPLYTPGHILQLYPPTYMIIAEYDVLRDDSIVFAEYLKKRNVSIDMHIYPTIHGFFGREVSVYGYSAVKEASTKLLECAAYE